MARARRIGMRLLVAVLGLAAWLGGPVEAAAAPGTAPLRVQAFAGGSNWPVWAGIERGFFAAHGVTVTLAFTPSSVAIIGDLAAGRVDIALTAIDNIVAYDAGEGEAALAAPADFVAFMGCDDGMLNVMAAPGIADLASLRGRRLGVDAMTTGFAFVLREILAGAGLGEADVQLLKQGGGAQRLAALESGAADATLLNTPLDLLAEAKGFRRLATERDAIGPYQGISGAARRAWLAAHGDEAVAFMRGYRDALRWLDDPASRAAADALLAAHLPGTSPELVERIAAALLRPRGGLIRDLAINPAGLATVLRLRAKYGPADHPLGDGARYVDETLRLKALAEP